MTKYVLNSGGVSHYPKLKQKFHRELIQGLGLKVRFLLCNFAQPRENWEGKYDAYRAAIAEDLPDNFNLEFELAIPTDFAKQCKKADVVYFHGGDDHLAQYWMRQFDIPQLFEGKVVATNSASSDMLVSSFWTCDWRMCMNGLGVLPIKFIPHFKSESYGLDDPRGPIDWDGAYAELQAFGDTTLPIHALAEGEFVVIQT